MKRFFHPSWMVVFLSVGVIAADIILAVFGVIKSDTGETEIIFEGVNKWFSERISGAISDTEAVGLGLGYLLGIKSALSSSLSASVKAVGMSHIIVVSGTHLAIIVTAAQKVFGRISRRSGVWFSVILLCLYVGVVGLTPSLIRAGIVAILGLIAGYYGRKIDAWRIILLVAAISLIYQPSFILSVSWQLSMAAYAGILILLPILMRFFYDKTEKPGFIASVLLASCSAVTATLPISLFYFGTFSFLSFVANLIILPTIPLAMGAMVFAGVFKVGLPAEIILKFHIFIIKSLSEHEEFIVEITKGNPAVYIIYIPVAALIITDAILQTRRRRIRLRGRQECLDMQRRHLPP